MKLYKKDFLVILAGAGILTVLTLCMTGCKMPKVEYQDDNVAEELLEEAIASGIGIDIDLTPGSDEDATESD